MSAVANSNNLLEAADQRHHDVGSKGVVAEPQTSHP